MAKKILIIEDNLSVSALLCSQLQKAGFEMMVAPDGMVGTQEANRWRPDLVLLDLMLPAGGGLGVLQNMKKSVYTQNTPVLVLTGSNDAALRKQVAALGIKTILQKPYNLEELVALIHQTIG